MINNIFYWIIVTWALITVAFGSLSFLIIAARHSHCENPYCVKFAVSSFMGVGLLFATLLLVSNL